MPNASQNLFSCSTKRYTDNLLLSLHFLWKTFRTFADFPSAIPWIMVSPQSAAGHIDEMKNQRWAANPVAIKRTYGFRICLNPFDRGPICPSIGSVGYYELSTTELFRKLLRKKMVIVDVGANIGWYSLLAAAVMNDQGTIIAYEPEPTNFEFLSKSIQINKFSSIRAFRTCVSDTDDYEILHLSPENLGLHSIINAVGTGTLKVSSVTLDAALTKMRIYHVDVIKIDVEGAEAKVIRGALKALRSIDHIIMEWDRVVWQGNEDILDALLGSFELNRIVPSPLLVKKVTKDELFALPKTNLYLRRM